MSPVLLSDAAGRRRRGETPLSSASGDAQTTHAAKPAPDLYRRAAAELGVACRTRVAFEDTPGGLESAETAGMKVIDVPRYR